LGAAAARRVRANEAAFIRKDGWLQGADERGWLSRSLSLPAPRSPTADRPPGRPGSKRLLLSLGWAKLVRGWRSTMMQVALSRPPSMFWQPWVQCPGETRISLLFCGFLGNILASGWKITPGGYLFSLQFCLCTLYHCDHRAKIQEIHFKIPSAFFVKFICVVQFF
jgi:hypothetical protein